MIWFVTVAAPALMLGLLAALYAAWRRFTGWTPVAARVVATDYSEAERWRDRPFQLVRPWHGFDWRYAEGDRWVETVLSFADAAGREHRVRRTCLVAEGSPEEAAHLLWFDPADPTRVSLSGPGSFLALATLCAIGLAVLLEAAHGG